MAEHANLQRKAAPAAEAKPRAASGSLSVPTAAERRTTFRESVAAARPNRTGLPDRLKAGIEELSGFSMDDVRVYYGSSKPAQLRAHAYAQGSDIHLAPGQERHLPHEAWHVVQQKQGRVRPTFRLDGALVNDDPMLEREADRVGREVGSSRADAALQCTGSGLPPAALRQSPARPHVVAQRTLDESVKAAGAAWQAAMSLHGERDIPVRANIDNAREEAQAEGLEHWTEAHLRIAQSSFQEFDKYWAVDRYAHGQLRSALGTGTHKALADVYHANPSRNIVMATEVKVVSQLDAASVDVEIRKAVKQNVNRIDGPHGPINTKRVNIRVTNEANPWPYTAIDAPAAKPSPYDLGQRASQRNLSQDSAPAGLSVKAETVRWGNFEFNPSQEALSRGAAASSAAAAASSAAAAPDDMGD